METMTDEELVMRLKEGRKEAFDELYDRYKNLAIRNAYLITGNRSDAEDVTQEAFVASYLHIGELKNDCGYRAWLMQILVRLSYRAVKRSKREFPNEYAEEIRERKQIQSIVNPDGENTYPDQTLDKAGASRNDSPLTRLIVREEADRVMKAVNALPVKQRIVVVLYYYDEMSVEEIAHAVKISAGTVKSRLFNARRRLKQLLGNHDENRAYGIQNNIAAKESSARI